MGKPGGLSNLIPFPPERDRGFRPPLDAHFRPPLRGHGLPDQNIDHVVSDLGYRLLPLWHRHGDSYPAFWPAPQSLRRLPGPVPGDEGVAGSLSFLALIFAFQLIPIATALVLFYVFPAFAALFSALLFKEKLSKNMLWILVALGGVAVILDSRLQEACSGRL